MNLVELNRISKSYDTKVAVHELSLEIEAGQMFGLLGPNGAGKTSTIRMMIGITMPDSGSVTLFGQPLLSQKSDSRRLSAGGTRPLPQDESDGPAGLYGADAWPGRGAAGDGEEFLLSGRFGQPREGIADVAAR